MAFTIYDSLPLGKKNAISGEDLARLHNLRDTRALRYEITEERNNGAFIARCDNGYFRPVTVQEFVECYKWFQARAISEFRNAKLFRNAIKNQFEGQQSLFDMQEDESIDRFFMAEGADV